jgi:hypothetical protein
VGLKTVVLASAFCNQPVPARYITCRNECRNEWPLIAVVDPVLPPLFATVNLDQPGFESPQNTTEHSDNTGLIWPELRLG